MNGEPLSPRAWTAPSHLQDCIQQKADLAGILWMLNRNVYVLQCRLDTLEAKLQMSQNVLSHHGKWIEELWNPEFLDECLAKYIGRQAKDDGHDLNEKAKGIIEEAITRRREEIVLGILREALVIQIDRESGAKAAKKRTKKPKAKGKTKR